MRGYTKADVQRHNDGGMGGPYYPAVNVKCYHFLNTSKVEDKFGCSEETAQKALEHAFEAQQDGFWNFGAVEDLVSYHFGAGVKGYSAGRSGGWLVVEGIGDVEDWDGVALNRWACFEKTIKAEVEYLCSDENVLELIEINRWAEDAQALESALGEVLEPVS